MRTASLLARLSAVLFLIGATSVALVPRAADAATVTVVITTTLSPRDVTVSPGTTVQWRNDDGDRHRPRSVRGPTEFDADLDPGESASVTLQAEGTYRYIDDRARDDESYWGSITVSASASAPAPGSTGGTGGGSTGGTGGTGGAPPQTTASVSMLDRSFSPSSVVVAPGGTVTWTNTSDRTHTVTSTSGAFDSGDVNGGGTFRFTFPSEGTFGYRCDLHPEMTGAVTVSAASNAAPAPPPSPAPAPAPATVAPTPAPAPTPAAGAAPTTRRVRVIDNAYEPAALGAGVGDTIVWTNAGRAPHTVTSASFDSGRLAPGATFSTVLRRAGTFTYGCTIHPEMVGSLTVGAASAAPSPPAAPPPAAASAAGAAAPDETSGDAAADGSAAQTDAPPATADVEVRDFAFAPRSVTVRPGGAVTWTWTGKAPHTVTGEGFDSGMVDPGATFSHTFDREGTFDYTCTLHPQMAGTVKVSAAAAASKGDQDRGTRGPEQLTATAAAARTSPPGLLFGVLGAAAILGGTASLLIGARRFMLAAD